jgi:hypothetical protein
LRIQVRTAPPVRPNNKSFLVLFFKKELLPYLTAAFAAATRQRLLRGQSDGVGRWQQIRDNLKRIERHGKHANQAGQHMRLHRRRATRVNIAGGDVLKIGSEGGHWLLSFRDEREGATGMP